MKRYFVLLLLLSGSLFAYPRHSPGLASPMHRLYHLEESRKIISQAESEGPIQIQLINLGLNSSNALWNPTNRTIYLNTAPKRTEGTNVRSILFELHNVLSSKEFGYYERLARQNKLSKEAYVEIIERIEHRNALNTVSLLNKGIRQQIFPSDAAWIITPCFEDHFRIQKRVGHSQFIACNYDSLSRPSHAHRLEAKA